MPPSTPEGPEYPNTPEYALRLLSTPEYPRVPSSTPEYALRRGDALRAGAVGREAAAVCRRAAGGTAIEYGRVPLSLSTS